FNDVAGLSEAKVELKEFVEFLKTPERFEKLGAKVPKGALLTGPPGTGKTLLAKAVAGEAQVPFFAVSGSDFVEMFVGVGPSRVRDLFKQARGEAPCIIYIDEIDAIARARGKSNGGRSNSERESTLNQLLVEMDGVDPSTGCMVLASTNRVDIMDKALLRPGRFDRQISCDLPTLSERAEIFGVHLRPLYLDCGNRAALQDRMAALTPGMSGAQIASVCNEAALHAARLGRKAVVDADFDYAVDRVSSGMERRSRVISKEERKIVAVHECGHAIVGWYLQHTDPVMKVSLVPRGQALGVTQLLPNDHHLFSAEALKDRMAVLLGGRAAEKIFFDRITTGAQDDLQRVTRMAYSYVTQYGMSKRMGPMTYRIPASGSEGKKGVADATAEQIDAEVAQLVESAFVRSLEQLQKHRDKLDAMSQSLLTKEILTYEDCVELLGPRP
ncbi:uncharacterized protein MONBRDRAFT_340, partial [Monosiga brevicollis MX1]